MSNEKTNGNPSYFDLKSEIHLPVSNFNNFTKNLEDNMSSWKFTKNNIDNKTMHLYSVIFEGKEYGRESKVINPSIDLDIYSGSCLYYHRGIGNPDLLTKGLFKGIPQPHKDAKVFKFNSRIHEGADFNKFRETLNYFNELTTIINETANKQNVE